MPSGLLKLLESNSTTSALFKGLVPILLLFLFSCENSSSKKNYAVIGGEIVNPTSKYVVIKNETHTLDSIPLDHRNKFSYKIEDVETGLYLIQHHPETQSIFLEPGDSLLLRVNTLAFDESLHFSGKGDAKNNFLTEMSLLEEGNLNLLLGFYKNDPTTFLKKSDSIHAERKSSLEKMSAKHKFSTAFIELANKIIDYGRYDLLERYTYLINRYCKKFSKKFPKDFYEYRKKVKFNEASIQCTPGYRRFIDNYLINRSFKWCAKQAFDNNDCYSLADNENIKSRIRMAGNLIHLPQLRRHFLSKLGSLGVIMAKDQEEIIQVITLLEEMGYHEKGLKDMKQLGEIQTAYLPGATIKNIPLINYERDQIALHDIIEKPTIIFLWSMYNERHISDHALVRAYRKKYPEINFIGLNLDVGETPSWRIAVQKHGYDKKNEFQLGQTGIDRKFFQYYLNKLLFLDSSGKVIVGDAFINSPDFESRILKFLNQ